MMNMIRRKKKILAVIAIIIIPVVVLMMYEYGLFHRFQPWPEYQFIGKELNELDTHLKEQGLLLKNVTLDIAEVDHFRHLSRKTCSSHQELYKFWGGEKQRYWWFPIGTKSYGLYVLVENGEIIAFHETVSIDSL